MAGTLVNDTVDHGRAFDWGRTSLDYSRHRPGYPPSFYERITALGIGRPGQRVLDLGTGTGNLARALARRGCKVTGIDISEPQVSEARRLAAEEGLNVDFLVRPAEETGLADQSFDVVAAAQSWLYFDRDRATIETRRLLAPGGQLLTCHIGWLPRLDHIAEKTEELILKFNPDWTGADMSGEVTPSPKWIGRDFVVSAFFVYQEAIPFTRKGWRGRIRACRAIGAELRDEEIEKFDKEHAELLERITTDDFTVLHWIDGHILTPK
ncbi:MAG: class I SAM-dependent methyltransferase [Candidatus Acidiferrales bacterium]